MNEPVPSPDLQGVRPSLVQLTHVIYGLHAVAVVIGVTSSATVAGGFVFGLPSLVAVFLNYLKRGDVAGTWLESHFVWQIRTFWYALLWAVVVAVLSVLLAIVLIGFALWVVGLFALGIWAIYRVARGWLALKDRRPMPLPN